MSEANHTKGLWEMVVRKDMDGIPSWTKILGGGRSIAHIHALGKDCEEELANGSLIARAREVLHECNDPNCPGNVNRRKLAAFDGLLEACKEAIDLPDICEEIGYGGDPDCVRDGHAMLKTTDGKYVKMHCQGGYPARDRILAMLKAAVAQVEE